MTHNPGSNSPQAKFRGSYEYAAGDLLSVKHLMLGKIMEKHWKAPAQVKYCERLGASLVRVRIYSPLLPLARYQARYFMQVDTFHIRKGLALLRYVPLIPL